MEGQVSKGLCFLEKVEFDLRQWTWIGGEFIIPGGKNVVTDTEGRTSVPLEWALPPNMEDTLGI